MRSVPIGRMSHWVALAMRDAATTIFYGLIESAKLAGVEPAANTCEATRQAIESPGTVTLPRDLTE